MQDLNLVNTVPADALAPTGAMLSTGTKMITFFFFNFLLISPIFIEINLIKLFTKNVEISQYMAALPELLWNSNPFKSWSHISMG